MDTAQYTVPTVQDINAKETKPSYVSKARELLERVTFERFNPIRITRKGEHA